MNKWKEEKGLLVLKMFFFLLHFQDDTISKSMTLFDTVLWYLLLWKHGTRTDMHPLPWIPDYSLQQKITCYSVLCSAAGYATKEIVPWVMADWYSPSWEIVPWVMAEWYSTSVRAVLLHQVNPVTKQLPRIKREYKILSERSFVPCTWLPVNSTWLPYLTTWLPVSYHVTSCNSWLSNYISVTLTFERITFLCLFSNFLLN